MVRFKLSSKCAKAPSTSKSIHPLLEIPSNPFHQRGLDRRLLPVEGHPEPLALDAGNIQSESATDWRRALGEDAPLDLLGMFPPFRSPRITGFDATRIAILLSRVSFLAELTDPALPPVRDHPGQASDVIFRKGVHPSMQTYPYSCCGAPYQ